MVDTMSEMEDEDFNAWVAFAIGWIIGLICGLLVWFAVTMMQK